MAVWSGPSAATTAATTGTIAATSAAASAASIEEHRDRKHEPNESKGEMSSDRKGAISADEWRRAQYPHSGVGEADIRTEDMDESVDDQERSEEAANE